MRNIMIPEELCIKYKEYLMAESFIAEFNDDACAAFVKAAPSLLLELLDKCEWYGLAVDDCDNKKIIVRMCIVFVDLNAKIKSKTDRRKNEFRIFHTEIYFDSDWEYIDFANLSKQLGLPEKILQERYENQDEDNG